MNYSEQIYKFNSGLTLVFAKAPNYYTSKIKVIFSVGAEDEKKPQGLAHLVEHCVFKGTSSRTQEEISSTFDKLAADASASTSSEFTTYRVAFPRPNIEKVMDVLSDMLFNSTFNQSEVEKEKQVILEEVKMRSDMPDTLAYDNLTKSMYKGTGLGMDIAGEEKELLKVKSQDMHEFVSNHYISPNTFISVVGDYDIKEVINLIEKYFNSNLKQEGIKKVWTKPNKITKGEAKIYKPTAQSNMILAYNSPAHEDMDRIKFNVISNILGGSMSSRLFNKVRNELSLCYNIYTFDINFKNNGIMAISLATSPEKAKEAYQTAQNEVTKVLKEGVTDEEFDACKELYLNQYLMMQDNPGTNLIYTAHTGKVLDKKSLIKLMQDMTKEECLDVFRKFVHEGEFFLSYVGKKIKL